MPVFGSYERDFTILLVVLIYCFLLGVVYKIHKKLEIKK